MAEKEYIEREAALSLAKDICVPTKWDTEYHHRSIDPLDVKELPAADVRPVRKGKWIDHQEGRWVYAKCSECETVHDVRSNFCPNCGADMREES